MADLVSAPLGIIATALTPVVMISANAALILGLHQKHAALGERLRTLAAEYRALEPASVRREVIRAEVKLFRRRAAYAATAHQWLNASVACFVAMVLAIAVGARSGPGAWAALALFVAGVVMTLGGIIGSLLELRLANQTLDLEIDDVLAEE